jgi:hypothetical protein
VFGGADVLRLAGGSIEAGLAATGEFVNRIVDQRFDVRIPREIVRQRLTEMEEARRARPGRA